MSITIKLKQKLKARNGDPFTEKDNAGEKNELTLGDVLHAATDFVPPEAKETMKTRRRRQRLGIALAADAGTVEWSADTLADVLSMCEERWGTGDTRVLMEIFRLTDEAQEPPEDDKATDKKALTEGGEKE